MGTPALPDGISACQALKAAQMILGSTGASDRPVRKEMVHYVLSEDSSMLAYIFIVKLTDKERSALPGSVRRFADAFRPALGLSVSGYGKAARRQPLGAPPG